MSKPFLSVVIPCYNCATTLRECVASVVSECEANALDYEVILVNDGSADETLAVCTELAGQNPHIKVLSQDTFVKDFLEGHLLYHGIQIASSISDVLSSLVEHQPFYNTSEIVADKVLAFDDEINHGDIETRFHSDSEHENEDEDSGLVLKVAILDSDVLVRKLLQHAFNKISAECVLFESGTDFVKAVMAKESFDLLVTEIFLPDMDGFSLLKNLQRHNFDAPIIVHSQVSQREAVIQALTLGAKTYLVKPQKPQTVVHKAVEILNSKE